MKGTPEEVLKGIPDFEEFLQLSRQISGLMYEKLAIESRLKAGESKVFKRASTEEQFFMGGKPPAVSYIDNTYKYAGLDGELLADREALASITAELEEKKLQMDIYKTMIEVWRTLCSNQRNSGM